MKHILTSSKKNPLGEKISQGEKESLSTLPKPEEHGDYGSGQQDHEHHENKWIRQDERDQGSHAGNEPSKNFSSIRQDVSETSGRSKNHRKKGIQNQIHNALLLSIIHI